MRKLIHQSKKNNIKVFKDFKKDGDYTYIVTDFQNNFIENLGNRDLGSVNRYLKL
jgi:hypothetical protein